MPYNTYVLTDAALIKFLFYFLHGNLVDEEEFIAILHASKNWDYQLILPAHIIFEISERINLGKTNNTITIKLLTDAIEELLNFYNFELEGFDERFLSFLVERPFDANQLNVSNALTILTGNFHKAELLN